MSAIAVTVTTSFVLLHLNVVVDIVVLFNKRGIQIEGGQGNIRSLHYKEERERENRKARGRERNVVKSS